MRRLGAALGLALAISTALPGSADAATIEQTYSVGNEPFGVTIDPADGRVYVSNSDNLSSNPGVLSVIDPAVTCSPFTHCVTSIALASPPTMSALDRDLRRLFVTTANNTLTFVDLATQSVVNTVPGAGGLGIVVDEPTHQVYAASSSALTMVDGVTGSVLHTTAAGPGDSWWAVALDAGARRVYVTNLDASAPSLVILSADDLSLVDEVPLPEIPRLALAVDTARQLVYVGGYTGPHRLYVVDANTHQVIRTVDLQAGATAPISATLVVAEDSLYLSQVSFDRTNGSVIVLDLATLTVVQRISLPWEPGATALHANGRLYVSGYSADVVAAVIRNSAPVVTSVSLQPADPRTNDIVLATASATDADGDTLSYTFTWTVDGAVRAVTSGPNASSSFDLSVAGNGDRGQTLSVEVVASDGALQSASMSASAVVANTPPTVTVSLSDPTPQSRDVLVATGSAQDADGDTLTLSYTWSVNGVVKQTGASNSFDLGVKGNGDNGDVVTVTANASDGSANASASANATVTPGHKH